MNNNIKEIFKNMLMSIVSIIIGLIISILNYLNFSDFLFVTGIEVASSLISLVIILKFFQGYILKHENLPFLYFLISFLFLEFSIILCIVLILDVLPISWNLRLVQNILGDFFFQNSVIVTLLFYSLIMGFGGVILLIILYLKRKWKGI